MTELDTAQPTKERKDFPAGTYTSYYIWCLTCCPLLSSLRDPWRPPHTILTTCCDLLNSGTLKYSSSLQWSTEAKFLPRIIKVNRILMGPWRLVKTLPGPGSAVFLRTHTHTHTHTSCYSNAARQHLQAVAK